MECGLGIVYHSATSGQGFIDQVEGRSVGENCSGARTRGQVRKRASSHRKSRWRKVEVPVNQQERPGIGWRKLA